MAAEALSSCDRCGLTEASPALRRDRTFCACGSSPGNGGRSRGVSATTLLARLCIVCSSASAPDAGPCHTDANRCAARDPDRPRQTTRSRHIPGRGDGVARAGAAISFAARPRNTRGLCESTPASRQGCWSVLAEAHSECLRAGSVTLLGSTTAQYGAPAARRSRLPAEDWRRAAVTAERPCL